jgi:bacterial/archaeal transporter family-2 protein
MRLVILAAALGVGSLLAVQAAANLRLGAAVRTPYVAAAIQIGLATVLLAARRLPQARSTGSTSQA